MDGLGFPFLLRILLFPRLFFLLSKDKAIEHEDGTLGKRDT